MSTAQRGRRIFLVEDNDVQLDTFARLLRLLGHEVEYAMNSYLALDVIRQFRPELVVLDIGLPGFTGFDICRQIREEPELSGVTVIAYTAYDGPAERQKAHEVGFDGYYVKPMSREQMDELFGVAPLGA